MKKIFNPHSRICLFILEREEEGKRKSETERKTSMWERNIDLLSSRRPDSGWNLQPFGARDNAQPTDQPGQGQNHSKFLNKKILWKYSLPPHPQPHRYCSKILRIFLVGFQPPPLTECGPCRNWETPLAHLAMSRHPHLLRRSPQCSGNWENAQMWASESQPSPPSGKKLFSQTQKSLHCTGVITIGHVSLLTLTTRRRRSKSRLYTHRTMHFVY